MKQETRVLLAALQQRQPAKEVKPLITAETAKSPDSYYNLRPLFWALSYGAEAEVVDALLSAYPDAANEKHPTEGWTALHYAEKLNPDTVKLLIARCPGAAKEADVSGALPLHWAAEHNAPAEVVKLLLQAYPEAALQKDEHGRQPARLAVEYGASEELLELLRKSSPAAFGSLPRSPPKEEDLLPYGLLFPGEGSQYVGMLDSAKELPAVQDLLRQARAELGYDILEVCLKGPESKLQEQKYCQPALFVSAMAAVEILRESVPEAASKFVAAAGLSVGEYAALACAGVFSFAVGLRLVVGRAKAMEEAANARQQAMLTLAGLDESKVYELCRRAHEACGEDEVCQISSYLFKKGFAVSGTRQALDKFQQLAKSSKALRCTEIQGSGGFHSSLMEPARKQFEAVLEEALPLMSRPNRRVYMTGSRRVVDWDTEPQEIIRLLSQQLTTPVRWKDAAEAMMASGLEVAYECGPMKQLKAMMKRIDNSDAWGRTMNIEV